MRSFKSSLLIVGMALVAFGQSACTKKDQSGTAQTSAAALSAAEPKITRAQAEQVALEKFPGSYLLSTELEPEDGKLVYSVEARTPQAVYEVVVDAMTGQVIETDDNTLKFRQDSAAGKVSLVPVDLAERDSAEQVALKAYPGKIQKWKAHADSGRTIFSFKIQTDAGLKKVVVAAGTNEILKAK
ncbi:MAG: PepSY domain-containing protein [candidate division KSB1 bacterium]|nr:PepSY domain-containing protein [candidate division KSB1 bacterium]MDZ7304701.1 PepSY domain-containing protein [candidate division KSB1 bacterium]MDZ7311687.1 PepSY domain-containing protein [candidate division KSB1 bacterium]